IPAGDGSSTTAATGSHPGAGPITGNRLTPLETAVVYIDTPRRTRWFPTAAHQGSRRDFVRRVQAAAADAARRGGAAGAAYLARAFEYIADNRLLLVAAEWVRSRGGTGPGVDGVRARDLGRQELVQLARALSRAVRAGTYRPAADRPVEIPKPGG